MSTYSFEKTLSKGTQYSLDETPIVDGKIRLTTDTKRLFFDVGDKRLEITDFIADYTESFILNNIDSPMPKIYLSKDTLRLFKWDNVNNRWNTISDSVDFATNADTAVYATKAKADESGNTFSSTYAKLNSPQLTGTPTAPTASGLMDKSITNVEYVSNYVANQLASLKNGMVVIVNSYSELPTVGESGKIYLVPSSSTSSHNGYDEYIWSTVLNNYEKFGTTSINLDGYFNDIVVSGSGNAITNITVDSANTSQLNINKGATFLTQHPTINRSTSSREESPVYGTKFDVLESLTMDSNGHITGYNTKKVTMVSDVNHANSADVADSANGVDWVNVNSHPTKLSQFTNDSGFLTSSGSIDNAGTAVVASKDNRGQNIDTTYVKSITNDSNKLRYIKGDGTNIDITVAYATNSDTAEYAKKANEANSAANATNASTATNALTAVYAQTAGSSVADVSWDAVTNKPTAYNPTAHYHTSADITDFDSAVQGIKVNNAGTADYAITAGSANAVAWANVSNKPTSIDHADVADSANEVDWTNVSNKPTSYTPSSHNHTTADITDFTTAVGAVTVSNAYHAYDADGVPWSGITNKPSAYTPVSHNHTTSNITDFVANVKSIKVNNASTADSAKTDINGNTFKDYYVNSSTVPFVSSITTPTTSGSNVYFDIEWSNESTARITTNSSSVNNYYNTAKNAVMNAGTALYALNSVNASTASTLAAGSSYGKGFFRSQFVSSTDWQNVFTSTMTGSLITSGHHGLFLIGINNSHSTAYTYIGIYTVTSPTSATIAGIYQGSGITEVRVQNQGSSNMFNFQIKTNSSSAPLVAYLIASS